MMRLTWYQQKSHVSFYRAATICQLRFVSGTSGLILHRIKKDHKVKVRREGTSVLLMFSMKRLSRKRSNKSELLRCHQLGHC